MEMIGCLATVSPWRWKNDRSGEDVESRGGSAVCLNGDIRAQNISNLTQDKKRHENQDTVRVNGGALYQRRVTAS